MADLIIKPSVGNLILKDDQNVTRVSIAPTTGVTTLSNQVFPASQVFPAGHVIQVESYYTATQGSQTVTNSDSIVNSMTKVVTPKGASSKFLVAVRWIGEVNTSYDHLFNIHMNSVRVNCPTTQGYGLSVAPITYWASDNATTPNALNFQTLVSTSSVIDTDITFSLVVHATTASASYTMWNNRNFNVPAITNEAGTSELIITEIKG
jgi:hypothetical protein